MTTSKKSTLKPNSIKSLPTENRNNKKEITPKHDWQMFNVNMITEKNVKNQRIKE